jgi:hypothetical protein
METADDKNMDLLLHNLRTLGSLHDDSTVGEEAADEIERLRGEKRPSTDYVTVPTETTEATAWVVKGPMGGVYHLSKIEGWSVDVVMTEATKRATERCPEPTDFVTAPSQPTVCAADEVERAVGVALKYAADKLRDEEARHSECVVRQIDVADVLARMKEKGDE